MKSSIINNFLFLIIMFLATVKTSTAQETKVYRTEFHTRQGASPYNAVITVKETVKWELTHNTIIYHDENGKHICYDIDGRDIKYQENKKYKQYIYDNLNHEYKASVHFQKQKDNYILSKVVFKSNDLILIYNLNLEDAKTTKSLLKGD